MVGSDFRDEHTLLQGQTGEGVVQDLLRYTRNVRRLNHILCAPYADLDELLQAYIETGCEIFKLETGIVSEITGETFAYKILKVQTPLDGVEAGVEFSLDETYCHEVYRHRTTIAFDQVGNEQHMREHPVYVNLHLEAYIATPIFVDGALFGTLNLSSRAPRNEGFSLVEKDMIELMARNIGNFIQFKHTQDQLKDKVKELQRSNEDLDEFAYVVAHDLKTPLRGIGNLAGFLKADSIDGLGPEQQEYLTLLEQQVDRMDRRIDDLLRYTRAGKKSSRISRFSLLELITAVGTSLLQETGMSLELPETDVWMSADQILLQQVFTHLIHNAVKHHDRAEGTVTVLLREEDGLACITIQDDGPGIDPRYQEKVFNVFERLTNEHDHEGTGIGLAMVNKLVKAAGGHVTLNSAVGEGCAFSVYWPLG